MGLIAAGLGLMLFGVALLKGGARSSKYTALATIFRSIAAGANPNRSELLRHANIARELGEEGQAKMLEHYAQKAPL